MTYILLKNNRKCLITTDKAEVENRIRIDLISERKTTRVKTELNKRMRLLNKDMLPNYKLRTIE